MVAAVAPAEAEAHGLAALGIDHSVIVNDFGAIGHAIDKERDRPKEPLEAFPLESIQMMGTITQDKETFALVKAGTKLIATWVYDNSKYNAWNPDPNVVAKGGPQSWDEMFIGYVTYVPPGERPIANIAQPNHLASLFAIAVLDLRRNRLVLQVADHADAVAERLGVDQATAQTRAFVIVTAGQRMLVLLATRRELLQRDAVFYPLFALALSVVVQALGLYLVFALLIGPALWTRRGLSLAWAIAVAVAACVAGLGLSWALDWPSGASVAQAFSQALRQRRMRHALVHHSDRGISSTAPRTISACMRSTAFRCQWRLNAMSKSSTSEPSSFSDSIITLFPAEERHMPPHTTFGGANRLERHPDHGAAPGAQLKSIRVCLFIAGCTAHALIDRRGGVDLEVVEALPRPPRLDQFGLVEPVERLGHRIVVAVAARADRAPVTHEPEGEERQREQHIHGAHADSVQPASEVARHRAEQEPQRQTDGDRDDADQQ